MNGVFSKICNELTCTSPLNWVYTITALSIPTRDVHISLGFGYGAAQTLFKILGYLNHCDRVNSRYVKAPAGDVEEMFVVGLVIGRTFSTCKISGDISLRTGSLLGHTRERCEERICERNDPVGGSLVRKRQESYLLVASQLSYRGFAACACDPKVSLLAVYGDKGRLFFQRNL